MGGKSVDGACVMRQDGSIATDCSLLHLAPLSTDDADAYYALLDRNRRHLTRHGNYRDVLTATHATVWDELSAPTDTLVMGIWLAQTLIGRVDLIPRGPGIFVIGYWLGHDFVGHGYATAACRALLAHARAVLGAVTVYAGVTRGNRASEAVLERLGFACVQDMGSFHRFRLDLDH
jgi:RimJ/RimL family protein N-acetyltransferase